MTARYVLIRRLLHWTVAVLIVLMVPFGLIFTNFDNRPWIEGTFGTGSFDRLYNLHKSVGFMVLGLATVRLAAMVVWPAPPIKPRPPLVERAAAGAVHGLLYALIFVTPLLGWLGTSAFPAPLPVFSWFDMPALLSPDRELSNRLLHMHSLSAYALATLATVHLCAALFHRNVRQDGVFDRMALFARRRG